MSGINFAIFSTTMKKEKCWLNPMISRLRFILCSFAPSSMRVTTTSGLLPATGQWELPFISKHVGWYLHYSNHFLLVSMNVCCEKNNKRNKNNNKTTKSEIIKIAVPSLHQHRQHSASVHILSEVSNGLLGHHFIPSYWIEWERTLEMKTTFLAKQS